jgi:hypothetical protein
MEQQAIQPLPEAPSHILLRRLMLDLVGIPPTIHQVQNFQSDDHPDKYQRLVESLLSSPAYGERWAQDWLDLARFAETDGFEHDKVRPDAWRYRQWVIDALNDDMPYDRFVTLQLSGDLTGQERDKIATLFCMAGPDMPDLNEQDLRRHDKLNEVTSTVGAVLLGLQMHCAQCHDHKYDPISIGDFYRLRTIFEAAVPVMLRDNPVLQLSNQPAPITPFVFYRGELHQPGSRITAQPPRIAASPLDGHFDSDNPRIAFAQWLFSESNPLTARVIANRVWQYHFGQSLCENPSDFGVVAGGPTHPELLDWLANRLRDSGWSLKSLHRDIVLSAAYRRASFISSTDEGHLADYTASLEADPENDYYSRFSRQRLDGEIVRDCLLAVSGQIDHQYGGPSVMPPLPEELTTTLLKGQWSTSKQAADHSRRSIYIFARRNLRYPIFEAFDRPDGGASCAQRDRSTTAIQSLHMLNGELSYQSAVGLAEILADTKAVSTTSDWIDKLFVTTLSRPPSESERNHFKQLQEPNGSITRENLVSACLALLNCNEFVYID